MIGLLGLVYTKSMSNLLKLVMEGLMVGVAIFTPLYIDPHSTEGLSELSPCYAEGIDEMGKEEILIIDEGLEYKIEKNGGTIEEILKNAQIEINEEDIIFPAKEIVFRSGTNIIIQRATPVILNFYGKEQKIFTQKEKISEVLIEKGIEIKENDLINVDLEKSIFPGIEIKIWQKPKPKEPEIAKTGRSQTGIGSWYNFIPGDFCASTAFKKGTKLLVTNLENGRQLVVTVNDYGPVNSRIIDLEKTAFAKLAPPSKGVIKVKVEEIHH